MHRLDEAFPLVFSVDEDIIQINNDEDIELFHKDLINLALKYCQIISQSKKHHPILKLTISSPKSRFLLISLANSHPVIGTSEVELGKPPSLP